MTQNEASAEDKNPELPGNDEAWRRNVRGVDSAMRDMLSDAASVKRKKPGLLKRLRAALGFKQNARHRR